MGLGRRRFVLGTLALAGGGLGVAVWSGRAARRRRLAPDPTTLEPSAWLQVDAAGGITLQVDRVEMGQGVITGFVTLVAEELDVPPDRIRPVLAPVHPRFQDPAQLTGESTSMRKRFEPLRQTGAAARALLLEAAAAEWGVAVATLDTDGTGHVVDAAGERRLAYAALAAAAARLPVPDDVALRDPARFRYIGGRVARPDLPDKVRGAARFGLDTQLPGLLTAVIARPPELRGALRAFDAAPARAVPGVVDVFAVPTGVAVVADGFWAARQGARALAFDWAPGPLAGFDTATMADAQARALASGAAHAARDDGDPAAVFAATTAAGGTVLAADYALPYLAHATLEPMNATLWFRGGACEAWIPSQAPDLARQVICDLAGLARESVTVHTTLSGGGFGRRATVDYVAEAAAIARRFDRPVKLVWTREDDLGHGPFREASRHALRATLGADGRISAWEHRLTGAGLNHLLMPATLPLLAPDWLPTGRLARAGEWLGPRLDDWFGSFAARQGSTDHPYALPATRVEVVNWQPGVPVTIWRSVGHSYNGFVVEGFIDELAALAGADPLAFRRAHLAAEPRVRAVLDLVADRSGWGRPPPGRAQGLALQVAFGSVVAQVAEVSCPDGRIRVHRVTCAVDCGTAVNPDVVCQQLEGGILFGLAAALYGEVHIDAGRVRTRNFDGYRQLTLADAPAVDVHIVPSVAPPGGIGEVGVPPIAPAVANAVFAATGQRLRQLPLRLAPGPA